MPDSSRRVQVDKDKARMFVIISVAAVITVASIVIAKGLWSRGNYLSKVVDKQELALKQLDANKSAVASLKDSYQKFVDQDPNLLSGSKNGEGDNDGDNATLILDALPGKYDFPALASSLEKMLTGYTITDIAGVDASAAPSSGTTAMEMPFELEVLTNYEGFKQLTDRFNRSIRPFAFTKLTLSGTSSLLEVGLTGKTYYQPEQGVKITETKVQ